MPTLLFSWCNRLPETKLQHNVPCVLFFLLSVGGIAMIWIARADTVGSCSMLPLEDGGVVDTKLKVCQNFLIGFTSFHYHIYNAGLPHYQHPSDRLIHPSAAHRCPHAMYVVAMGTYESFWFNQKSFISRHGIRPWRARWEPRRNRVRSLMQFFNVLQVPTSLKESWCSGEYRWPSWVLGD